MTDVAIVHDYLTQRGGAERVALTMADMFAGSPVYTSLYDPSSTFSGFGAHDVRALPINRLKVLREHHRLAFPVLAPAFSGLRVRAGVALCSSSGWAHGTAVEGRKVVYCHAPARWLYQAQRYTEGGASSTRLVLGGLSPWLRRWDKRAAATAARYLVNSNFIKAQVQEVYGIDAEVVPPPMTFEMDGPVEPIEGLDNGFFLCVSRLMPYKNVGAIVEAFGQLPGHSLVVAGTGPAAAQLKDIAGPNVSFVGRVNDATLRWLYRSCTALVAASYEDFGLTPVEAAAHGKPVAVLRWGGFLDTTIEGTTGVFFDRPQARAISDAITNLLGRSWRADDLRAHAETYSVAHFCERIRSVVAQELAQV